MDPHTSPSTGRIFAIEGQPACLRILGHVLRDAGLTVMFVHPRGTASSARQFVPDHSQLSPPRLNQSAECSLLLVRARLSPLPTDAPDTEPEILNVIELSETTGVQVGHSAPRTVTGRVDSHGCKGAAAPQMAAHEPARSSIAAVHRLAQGNFKILILGEHGSGKEQIARAIHRHSRHATGPFVTVDCAKLSANALALESSNVECSEDVDSVAVWQDKFDAATRGTLFLDGITHLSRSAQGVLLHVLEERWQPPATESYDASEAPRIITGSPDDLLEHVNDGSFRRELYCVLSECIVRTPGITGRAAEDLPFPGQEANTESSGTVPSPTHVVEKQLQDQTWIGNIMEPRCVTRTAEWRTEQWIRSEHLHLSSKTDCAPSPESVPKPTATPAETADEWADLPLRDIVRRQRELLERDLLNRTLDRAGGNKTLAARLLSIGCKTLRQKLRVYGIER